MSSLKVCFNMSGVGLANNGGSRTLIRCAEAMRENGVDVFFHSGPSRYTWHQADITLKGGKHHPECDISIATGINSVSTVSRYKNARLRTYYVRGFELWKADEAKLLDSYLAVDHVFVNSQWLYDYMRLHSIPATLQYSGIDYQWFRDLHPAIGRGIPPRQYVGAMMHNKHKTKRSVDALELEKRLGQPIKFLNRDIKHPDSPTLNSWYNTIKVWFAPTELEGLHNPPMEAGLAGCALVCSDAPRGGMSDYAIHNETALVYPARDIDIAEQYVRKLLADEELRRYLAGNLRHYVCKKIGSRNDRMREFYERLSNLTTVQVL